MMQGHPITAKLPEDLGIGERFWYWHGASGQSYIHSIYPVGSCPPLPDAVYVAVRKRNGQREAVSVGRFSGFWDSAPFGDREYAVDELHVHLLARGDAAVAVFADLHCALAECSTTPEWYDGFGETNSAELIFV